MNYTPFHESELVEISESGVLPLVFVDTDKENQPISSVMICNRIKQQKDGLPEELDIVLFLKSGEIKQGTYILKNYT